MFKTGNAHHYHPEVCVEECYRNCKNILKTCEPPTSSPKYSNKISHHDSVLMQMTRLKQQE